MIKKTVKKFKNSVEKPKRITINKIETETGMFFLARNLDKLPQIREYLKNNIESLLCFQIRKAKWAILYLEENNEEVSVSKIRQLLNLYNTASPRIIKIINELVIEHSNSNNGHLVTH